jgi:hypothetical protein
METSQSAPGIAPRSVGVERAVAWWSGAWQLFTRAPGMWIVLTLVMIVLFIVLGLVPILGGLAVSVLAAPLAGGWILAARKVDSGGALEVGDLFAGFKDKLVPLLVIGVLILVASIAIGLIGAAIGLGAVAGIAAGSAADSGGGVFAAVGIGLVALCVVLLLAVIVGMAVWYAPALVVLRNVEPVDAIKLSFAACLKNVVPFLVFGVLYLVAAIVASIPFGLGWIVLLPVLMLTIYVSHKEVFAP